MKIFNIVNCDTILWKQKRSIFLKGPESEPSNEIYVQSCTTSRDVWQRSLDPPKLIQVLVYSQKRGLLKDVALPFYGNLNSEPMKRQVI